MNLVLRLASIILSVSIATVHSRVPLPPNSFQTFRRQPIIQHQPVIHHQTIIQHPPVLIRPPVPSTTTQAHKGQSSNKINNSATTTAKTTTTTAEPPEMDDDFFPPRQRSRSQQNFNSYDYYYNYNNYAPTTYGYDFYGLGFGFNGAGVGGVSREVEYDNENPTTRPPRRRQQIRPTRPPKPTATTTTTTTTTTPETPEPDDDIVSSPTPGHSAAINQEPYTGYCFCSPLSTCPTGSIPRGGACNNFLTYFINLRFIRCCYRPSVARSLQL